jgi:hypothetical protein
LGPYALFFVYSHFVAHLAVAAFFANSLRSLAVRFLAAAVPPFLPRLTAAGSFGFVIARFAMRSHAAMMPGEAKSSQDAAESLTF